MIELYTGAAGVVGLLLGYIVAKKVLEQNDKSVLKARALAKALEHEAKETLNGAKASVLKQEKKARSMYDSTIKDLTKEHEEKLSVLEKEQFVLSKKLQELDESIKKYEVASLEASRLSKTNALLKEEYEEKSAKLVAKLENTAGLTQDEAKAFILQKTKENARAEVAHIVRKYEEDARIQGKTKANYIIAQATSRFAGEYVAERLINVINLKDDDLKGRIIGKEGRNVKALEMTLGVDIIIDETPNTIVVSCFNLYRRAIATKVIELLIEDGRIQPARVEKIHEKVQAEFEDSILEEGKNIVMDLGLKPMAEPLSALVGKLRYRASYGQNALAHSLEVAHIAGMIAAECGGDVKLARRAGLLHDIGKALTHEQEGSHVDLGAMVARRYGEDAVVINAIFAHHGHEEARSIEAAAVCAADTLSAARPGARREVLAVFLSRVSALEDIAMSKPGVKQAYAINAGREIRVIVNAKLVNDDESALLAKEIASEIEEKLQYPGEIKVNIIRELRALAFAR